MAYHAGLPGFMGGGAGVDVFFVLSGFLITSLLVEEHARAGRIRLGAFYMRRLLRLYPALVTGVVVALILAALKIPVFNSSADSFDTTLDATPYALFYSMNVPRAVGGTGGGFLGHTWSLAIEEQFYLVWPVAIVLVMRKDVSHALLGWIALGCAVASAALRAGLNVAGFRPELLYNATFSHVDGVFIGCFVAIIWVTRRGVLARLSGSVPAGLAVLVAAMTVIHGQNMNSYGYLVVALSAAVVLADLLVRRSSLLSRIMSGSWAVAIGKRSYGLYLYHWPIFLFIGIDRRTPVLVAGFGATFAAAWTSYRFIEQPFLRLKSRWSTAS